jgi:DNA sulfur modification protein DndE
MTWKVFGGKYESLYLALLRRRCHEDGLGLDDETLAIQFRLHLHGGIGYLAACRDIRSLADLVRRIAP